MNKTIKSIAVATIMLLSLIIIIVDIAPMVEGPAILEVDDSGGKPYINIQAAVDDAQPGDTVYVYPGIYYEDVVIDKTINLTGEDRDTTIINASAIGIFVQNIDYVNISGFTIVNGSSAGIRLIPSNNSLIQNSRIELNNYGIQVIDSNNTVVRNNIASNNSNYHGIYLDRSTNITIKNNICINNSAAGIRVYDSSNDNLITDNFCSDNNHGIYVNVWSNNNRIINNNIKSNKEYGIRLVLGENNIMINNTLIDNYKAIAESSSTGNQVINSTMVNSTVFDITVGTISHITLLNTTFNKSKTYFFDIDSTVEVKWFLHVNVIDYLGNPVQNANIKIEDNKNGLFNESLVTDMNGQIKWLTVTEYYEQDPDGDTIGNKTYYTPHRIIAWNDTLVGYAYPEPNMNESKTITIILYDGTLMDLKPGWNLVSLPRIQSDTNLQTVLQSIEGRYDSVQCYNITDSNDQWKHYHVSKPSYMTDLKYLNHIVGFWLHIIDPHGTTLVVIGNELTSEQNISIYPGWNLVGYPSKLNKTRDVALDNLFYGSDVDSIWTYNSTMQKWIELKNPTNYFEIGHGYWMHSKVTKIWNVPL